MWVYITCKACVGLWPTIMSNAEIPVSSLPVLPIATMRLRRQALLSVVREWVSFSRGDVARFISRSNKEPVTKKNKEGRK